MGGHAPKSGVTQCGHANFQEHAVEVPGRHRKSRFSSSEDKSGTATSEGDDEDCLICSSAVMVAASSCRRTRQSECETSDAARFTTVEGATVREAKRAIVVVDCTRQSQTTVTEKNRS